MSIRTWLASPNSPCPSALPRTSRAEARRDSGRCEICQRQETRNPQGRRLVSLCIGQGAIQEGPAERRLVPEAKSKEDRKSLPRPSMPPSEFSRRPGTSSRAYAYIAS
jgi:hypothetical protein